MAKLIALAVLGIAMPLASGCRSGSGVSEGSSDSQFPLNCNTPSTGSPAHQPTFEGAYAAAKAMAMSGTSRCDYSLVGHCGRLRYLHSSAGRWAFYEGGALVAESAPARAGVSQCDTGGLRWTGQISSCELLVDEDLCDLRRSKANVRR